MANILIISRWYPNEDNPVHGIFVREFAKASAIHNNVIVLYGELTERRQPLCPYEISDTSEKGIRTIRFLYRRQPLKLHRIVNLMGFVACLRKLSQEEWRPDIIHLHVYLASLPIFVYAKLKHIPIVITEHYTGFVRQHGLSFFERLLARFIFKRSDIILPVSVHLKNALTPYAPSSKFTVVPNVVDIDMFKLSQPVVKSKSEIKNMVMVGRLDPVKGGSYLLEALNLLKMTRTDFFLHIIGDGTQRDKLKRKMNDLGLNHFIRFYGIMAKPNVAKLMSECDFFVLPSLFETFGCVIIESMACGKPVIATNIGGPNAIVIPETGILVPPGNTDALRDGINFMLDNYYSYSASKIRDYVDQNFSLQVIGKRLDMIYQQLLK